jgi:release factor glutamine methyltransferase
MNRKFSQLDDSYWSYAHPDIKIANAKFLERHHTAGVYEVAGLSFECPSGIYQPHEFGSTRFALRGLFSELPAPGTRLLELGTGSGTVGICLSAAGLDVTMADIDPIAVACAKNNARANHISARVFQSDLFGSVGDQKYDAVFFNIPLLDKPVEEPLEIISCDHGGALFRRFLAEAPRYLLPGGQVYVVVANIGNRESIMKALSNYEDKIIYAEFYAGTSAWRWLISAKPLSV